MNHNQLMFKPKKVDTTYNKGYNKGNSHEKFLEKNLLDFLGVSYLSITLNRHNGVRIDDSQRD